MSDPLSAVPDELRGLFAAGHAQSQTQDAKLEQAHQKLDWLIQATRLILTELSTMTAIHDAMKAKVTSNATLIAGNTEKITTLIGLKDKTAADNDAASQDVLDLLNQQGDQLKAHAAVLDNAIKEHQVQTEAPVKQSATYNLTVASAVPAPAISIPVTTDATALVGASVSGPGIADGTTVTSGTTADTLALSASTTTDFVGGESLTVMAAA